MSVVVDTSAWIEWITMGPRGADVERELPDRALCLVPTLVQLELAKWLTRERSEQLSDLMIAYTLTCIVVPLDTQTALSSAEICNSHRLSTADSVIYATALQHDATLLTCDAHFAGLPGVKLLAKTKGN